MADTEEDQKVNVTLKEASKDRTMEGNEQFERPDLFSDSNMSSVEQKSFESKDFLEGDEKMNVTFGDVPIGRGETLEDMKPVENPSSSDENEMIPTEDLKPFESEDFTCNICQKKCDDISDLTEHLASHSYKVFPCDYCPEIFFSKQKLKEHKKGVHPNERKRRKKDITKEIKVIKDKKLSKSETKPNKSHTENNTGLGLGFGETPNYYEADLDKDFRCEHCFRGFDRKLNLVIHMKKYHGETMPSQKAIAKQRAEENRGEGAISQGAVPSSEKHLLNCDECQQTFATEYLLKKHKKFIHAGKKCYKCETCGDIFGQQETLDMHKNIHTGRITANVSLLLDFCPFLVTF